MAPAEEGEDVTIIIADQDGVDSFEPLTTELLTLLGHPEALVTDESELSHFIDFTLQGEDYKQEKERIWSEIEAKWGVDVRPMIYLLDILRAISTHNAGAKGGLH